MASSSLCVVCKSQSSFIFIAVPHWSFSLFFPLTFLFSKKKGVYFYTILIKKNIQEIKMNNTSGVKSNLLAWNEVPQARHVEVITPISSLRLLLINYFL